MKLTFSTLGCPTWTLDQIIAGAKSAGYGGVDFRGLGAEIDITKLPDFNDQLDRTLGLFRDSGLKLPCFNTSVTLVTPHERWQAMLEEFERYARLAARTGAMYLRLFGGATPKGMTEDEAYALATRHLRQLIKIGQSHQCMPIVETHDAWCSSPRLLSLLADLKPNQVGLLWDVEHLYRRGGEQPEFSAAQLKDFIRHTHFRDSRRVNEKVEPRLMGQGDLPLKEFVRSLKSIGYDGWYCLEAEKRWFPQEWPDPEEMLPNYAQYMNALDREAAGGSA